MSRRPQQKDVPQVHLSSREHITRFQLDSVLLVMSHASQSLGHFIRLTPEDNKFTPVESEARIAIENTVQAACARMDKILEEDARWSMDFQMKVEKQFEDAQKLQMEVLADQRSAAKEVTSPHFRYRPALLRLVDGTWAAFLGDVNDMDQGVVGVGNTPQDAIEAFDDAWKGVTNEKVLAWAKERETNLEQGQACKPFPKITNENQTLDDGRNQETQGPSEGGDAGPRNS